MKRTNEQTNEHVNWTYQGNSNWERQRELEWEREREQGRKRTMPMTMATWESMLYLQCHPQTRAGGPGEDRSTGTRTTRMVVIGT